MSFLRQASIFACAETALSNSISILLLRHSMCDDLVEDCLLLHVHGEKLCPILQLVVIEFAGERLLTGWSLIPVTIGKEVLHILLFIVVFIQQLDHLNQFEPGIYEFFREILLIIKRQGILAYIGLFHLFPMVDVIEGRYVFIFSFKEACEGPLAFRHAPCPIFFVIITNDSDKLALFVKFFVAGKLTN